MVTYIFWNQVCNLTQNKLLHWWFKRILCIPLTYALTKRPIAIRSFYDPHLSACGLNTKRYSVSVRIQSESGKIRTRKTPKSDTFHAVILFKFRQKHFFRKIINIKAYTIFRSSQIKQPALYVGNMGQNLPTEFNIQRCHSFIKQDD